MPIHRSPLDHPDGRPPGAGAGEDVARPAGTGGPDTGSADTTSTDTGSAGSSSPTGRGAPGSPPTDTGPAGGESAPGKPADGAPIGRRVVLAMVVLGAVGVVTGRRVQTVVEDVLAPVQSRDPTGLTSLIPDGGGFRFYSVTSTIPSRNAANYRLTVGGLVDRPTTLTLPDLRSMRQTQLVRDFQCVTGWRVPQVHWAGVPLADLLDRVGVRSSATAVRFTSFDGTYTESLTLAQARRPDVLVALEMLGKPVSRDHGGPVRLYVAPMYGYKSCKWLGGIEVTNRVEPGYWEQNGYDVDGWVGHSNGRDDDATS